MLTSFIGVIILLGGLIFFHELGHYSVAKFFNIKVEVFSLGFGKKIFRKQWGETEYTLSIIPFGGYVKMMGDDPFKGVPAAEVERSFSTQKLYKRFLVVAAGPLANLLLAYVLFSVIFWNGQPTLSSKIGSVSVASPAWEAGIRPKDRVVEALGKKITTWNELEDTLKTQTVGEKADIKIQREGSVLNLPVMLSKVRIRDSFGEEKEVTGIKGIAQYPLASVVGISSTKSLAFQSGLRASDQITKIENRAVQTYEDLNEALQASWEDGKTISVTHKRKDDKGKDLPENTISIKLPKLGKQLTPFGAAEALGIYPSEVFVRQVTADSPASKAGLKAGDRIAKVGTTSVYNFEAIVDQVQENGSKGETIVLTLERDGQLVSLTMTPVHTTLEDPITHQPYKKYLVGFAPNTFSTEAETTKVQVREAGALISKAFTETNDLAYKMLLSLVKLATGQISVKNLGGPVLIASVAGKSLDAGLIPFLQVMALISINLFLLNLFPIPVLDGGHLLFFTIEALKGKPVSIRTMEIANQVGMAVILMLVGLTLFNDITRIILH